MMELDARTEGGPWSGADRVEPDTARRWILEHVTSLAPTAVPLAGALGLVLAHDVVAMEPSPGFDTSAMDGYAVRARPDASAPTATLAVVGTSAAGRPYEQELDAGQAVRIMTGARVPVGAEAVVPLEVAIASDDAVTVAQPLKRGWNIRCAGEDHRPGDVVVRRGVALRPAHIAVLAALGCDRPVVVPRVRVGVLSTGDEIGAAASSAGIRDANRPGLLALVDAAGHTPVDLGAVGDDADLLERRIRAAVASCDAVLTTGGVSVGDHDDVKRVLGRVAASAGGDARWMQVALRPAKPLMVAFVGAVPVFGLPGNPASALVSYELFARPALERLAGSADAGDGEFDAVAAVAFDRVTDGRMHVVAATATVSAAGVLEVRPIAGRGHHLAATADANVHVRLPDGSGVRAGGLVRCTWISGARGPAT